tara:strand:- start:28 stop:162 length:135 start_codon:yes stop_codon:yes gene_type:complete
MAADRGFLACTYKQDWVTMIATSNKKMVYDDEEEDNGMLILFYQ